MSDNLDIRIRATGGKREARKIRHEGRVPGVVYGSEKEPSSVSMDAKALEQVCFSSAFFSHVIDVKLDGKAEKILPRDVDYHPVTDKPIHVDFQRISKDSKVKINVAIEFIDEDKSMGMKRGGVLNVVVHNLECLCSANSIPEKFTLSLAGKDIGDSLLLGDIDMPKGASPAHPERDSVIATLVNSRTVVDAVSSTETSQESSAEEE